MESRGAWILTSTSSIIELKVLGLHQCPILLERFHSRMIIVNENDEYGRRHKFMIQICNSCWYVCISMKGSCDRKLNDWEILLAACMQLINWLIDCFCLRRASQIPLNKSAIRYGSRFFIVCFTWSENFYSIWFFVTTCVVQTSR